MILGLAYVSTAGSLLAPTKRIRFGCEHSSTRGGSRTVIERSSAGGILACSKDGAGSCFPVLNLHLAAHPEQAGIMRMRPVTNLCLRPMRPPPQTRPRFAFGVSRRSTWRD